jgi:hypothetical protein
MMNVNASSLPEMVDLNHYRVSGPNINESEGTNNLSLRLGIYGSSNPCLMKNRPTMPVDVIGRPLCI